MSTLFLTCPVEALIHGIYKAKTNMSELKQRGSFGIGTFNNLDGEMIVLEGQVYRADANGHVCGVADHEHTPFACVTHFHPDTSELINSSIEQENFWDFLKRLIPSENMAYALLIQGEFDLVHARSVPAQNTSRPLVEVTRTQPEFKFQNTKGSLVGFYTPTFIKSLVIPGFHLHFIDEKLEIGGHLLNCRVKTMQVQIQHIPELAVGLPMSLDFLTTDFSKDIQKDIDEAES